MSEMALLGFHICETLLGIIILLIVSFHTSLGSDEPNYHNSCTNNSNEMKPGRFVSVPLFAQELWQLGSSEQGII